MVTKYLVGALLVSVVASGLLGRQWLATRDKLTAEALRAEQLDGQLSALQERAQRAAEARAAGEQLRIEVRNATGEWGNGGVPDGIVERLCERAHCATGALPPPGD